MPNKKKLTLATVLAFALAAAFALTAVLTPAGSSLFGPYATSATQTNTQTNTWIHHGIIPNLNQNTPITYNDFAGILHRLLGYSLNERYTHLSGHMHITESEAHRILNQAMGRTAQTPQTPPITQTPYQPNFADPPNAAIGPVDINPVDINPADTNHAHTNPAHNTHAHTNSIPNPNAPLNHYNLSRILYSYIQIFIATENFIDLNGAHLDGALVINHQEYNPYIVIFNASGQGDIIISGSSGGTLHLHNIKTTGNIIIINSAINLTANSANHTGGAPQALMDITIADSTANTLIFHGQSNINLTGSTDIQAVYFENAASLNTMLLARSANPPSVVINSPHARLSGGFFHVENNLHNHVIFADGAIENFTTHGNVLIMGEVRMEHIQQNDGALAQIIHPDHFGLGLAGLSLGYLELLAAWNDMMELHMHSFFDFFQWPGWNWSAFWQLPSSHVPVIGPPGWPPPAPNPTPNPPITPPPGALPINPVLLNIIAPHIDRPSGLPAGLLAPGYFIQTQIHQNPQFTGEISWYNNMGQRLTNRPFDRHTAYTAKISLTARQGFYFPSDTRLNLLVFGNVRYNMDNNIPGQRQPHELAIELHFYPIEARPAEAFTIRPIQQASSQIHIHTAEYMGTLNPANFQIHFGDSRIGVLGVSGFNETASGVSGFNETTSSVSNFNETTSGGQGYYTIQLARPITPDGTTPLHVQMLPPLPFHLPYPNVVSIVPQAVDGGGTTPGNGNGNGGTTPGNGNGNGNPAPPPYLNPAAAAIGQHVFINNFPHHNQDEQVMVLLSPYPAGYPIDFWSLTGNPNTHHILGPAQSFQVPPQAARQVYHVYVVFVDRAAVVRVGVLWVEG